MNTKSIIDSFENYRGSAHLKFESIFTEQEYFQSTTKTTIPY